MIRRAIGLRDTLLGGGLMILAVCVAVPTVNMPVGFSYDGVGPRAFPYTIAALLFAGGLAILWSAIADRNPKPAEDPVHWAPILIISSTLLFQMAFIRSLGWIPVATVSFAAVAWAFGSRQVLLSLAFGLALASGTFALFNYGLGLRLPSGLL